jgi:hypothetical protein
MYGAIAILNEKETGLAIFAIALNTNKQNFNEEEFRKIVESINFDTISAEEYQKEFRAFREKMEQEISGDELSKTLEEYLETH